MIGAEAMRRRGEETWDEDPVLHVPVLPQEIVAWLGGDSPEALSGWIVDGTLGLGGHTTLLLERLPNVRVLGIDQDPVAREHAREHLAQFGDRVRVRDARLSELGRVLRKERIGRPIGMLLDLGASSLQLDTAERGFSFRDDGPLDMRMDPTRERTAADIVNRWDESDLADLFYYEGDERRARPVARAIVEARRRVPFQRTSALAEVIARAVGKPAGGGKIHPATRCFQALRRAVNEEGEELLAGLAAADHWLAGGGRLAVIAFHSGEDREVKRYLGEGAREGRWNVLTRKPVRPGAEEERVNRRSRSARLRVAERVRPAGADDARELAALYGNGNGNGNGHGHDAAREVRP